MKPLARLAAFGAVVAFLVMLAGTAAPASALPTSLTLNSVAANATVAVPGSVLVNAGYNDEGAAPQEFALTSSVPAVGYFYAFSMTANNKGQVITPTPAVNPTTLTVAEDGDATVDATAIQTFFLCVTAGTTTISSTQGGGTIATPLTITCTGATTTVTFSANPATIGLATNVTVACTAAGQALTASPTTAGAFGTTVTNGTFVSASQVNCAAPGNMTAMYTCAVASTVTFALAGTALTPALTCGAATTGGLVLSSTTGYSVTVTGTCTAGAVLTQTGPANFTGATINGVAVVGVTAGSIPCTTAGTIIATLVCNSTGTVYLALGGMSGTFYCSTTVGQYNPYPYNYCGTGTYNPYAYNAQLPYTYGNTYANANCYNQQQVVNVPTSLSIAAASPSVACGSTANVTVRVTGTNGQNVADGTAVALAASVGTLSPASATTSGGAVTATYTAPANVPATNVTLRATAGAASNTTGISITCAQTTAPAPSQPASPPPVYAPAPPPSGLVISPPNTGDAGLLALRDENCD